MQLAELFRRIPINIALITFYFYLVSFSSSQTHFQSKHFHRVNNFVQKRVIVMSGFRSVFLSFGQQWYAGGESVVLQVSEWWGEEQQRLLPQLLDSTVRLAQRGWTQGAAECSASQTGQTAQCSNRWKRFEHQETSYRFRTTDQLFGDCLVGQYKDPNIF